jgi:hypothetical protein
MVRDRQPGDKHADSQSYPRACDQTGCAYRHDSFVAPAGVRKSHFFDQAENQKDQQGRSLIATRQQRTFWPPKARHECEREGCRY